MTAQILAAVIFVGMFALIIMDKFERQYVTLGSAALVLVVVFGICMHSWDAIKNALNLGAIFRADFWYGASESASSGVNWSTIFFITGMMIMVEGLGKSGFFRWLCLSLAKATHYHVVPLLVCFMAMAAFLAMFIDSITVVLFLATVTLELAQILCFDPVPMILSEVFCANLGGAATMCGDPPNIIIGTALGYTFTDFIQNTGVIVGICFVFVLLFFWLCFRKPLKASEAARPADAVCPAPATAIADRKAFIADVIVFLIAVALLVTHAQTRLTVACIGVIVAALTLLVTVCTNGSTGVKEVLRGVDSPGEDDYAGYRSERGFTDSEFRAIADRLNLKLSDKPLPEQVRVETLTDAGQVAVLRVGEGALTGRQVRKAFGLRSQCFDVSFEDGKVVFSVRGFGHGVGMSQNGADAMARAGSDFCAIIAHYYTGVEIVGMARVWAAA